MGKKRKRSSKVSNVQKKQHRELRIRNYGIQLEWKGSQWKVVTLSADQAVKTYRCPGCNQYIQERNPHVVVWEIGCEDDRRHWHSPCWKARETRS